MNSTTTAPDEKSLLTRLATARWRILGLILTTAAIVVALSHAEPSREAAEAITAQQLIRSQIGDITDALPDADGDAPRALRFSYQGIDHLESTARTEALQVGEFTITDDPQAPLLTITTTRPTDADLGIQLSLTGPETDPSVETEATQRIGNWQAILPPLIAILAALFLRQILLAMAAAVWFGAMVLADFAPLAGTTQTANYLVGNITDSFNLYIIGFTFALVGMVHVIIRMGGMAGVLDLTSHLTRSARSTRITTALMGFLIFFDDYANTIVVGTTMRPISDRRRISREKLAYIVDSTSAPIAGLAIISTWIGYEVGLFEDLANQLNLDMSGYEIFLGIIPFRFYCLFALAFVLWNVFQARDFGPMRAAEERAQSTGQLLAPGALALTSNSFLVSGPKDGIPHRWLNAALPIGAVLVATMAGIFASGHSTDAFSLTDLASWQAWQDAFSNADAAMVLFWAAVLGTAVALGLAMAQRLLSPLEAIKSWFQTLPSMWMAVAILILAWSIRSVCDDLGTSIYLVSAVEGLISLTLLPLLTFALAAIVAFATGTSWGAMGILLPTMIPLAAQLGDGSPQALLILMLCFAAVLDGAIYGDHCSPISDTTIMSSIAAGSDHIDHVRTQMPYATVAMLFAAGFGYLGVAFGLSPWLALPLGIFGLGLFLRLVGTKSDRPQAQMTDDKL